MEAVMAKKSEKDRTVQTGLRIRASLRDRLEKEAKHKGLSLNSEIEMRLEESFKAQEELEELMSLMREMPRRLAKLEEEQAKREEDKAKLKGPKK
jgi:hypothetical protein